MLTKCIAMVVTVLFLGTNSLAASSSNQLLLNKKEFDDKSLNKLMINKKAFDQICNTITRTVSNLPECEDCPTAKAATRKFEIIARKLERINDNLINSIPDPGKLGPAEKAASMMIYRSIAENAFSIKEIIGNIIGDDEITLKALEPPTPPEDPYPPYGDDLAWWVPAAVGAVIVAAIADTADDADDATCRPITDEDECRATGCSWRERYHCVGENNACCEFITDEWECYAAADADCGCNWSLMEDSGYCRGGSDRTSIAP